MVDPKAEEVEITVAGRDFTIRQSPGILQSKRGGGTTGAVVWRSSVEFAEWLASLDNSLFKNCILDSNSVVLELGSGISGHVASTLSARVDKVIATDQQYVLNLLRENINANRLKAKGKRSARTSIKESDVEVLALDWETDEVPTFLRSHGLDTGVDAVVVCDCIFNYALIDPLLQTCKDINKVRETTRSDSGTEFRSTIYIFAQQLRQPDVFEQWLEAFTKAYRLWRLPSIGSNGLVIHVGIVRAKR